MISIVMPVFNSSIYIEESINSILKSTFHQFELIIVDDGSTDNTKKIIQTFKDDRIKYYYKSNSGIGDSLNFGIKKSKFDIIARMDSDDIMHKDRLHIQLNYFDNNNIDVLGSNAFIINNNGKQLSKTNLPLSHNKIRQQLEYFESPIIHPSVIFKKILINDIGGYYTRDAEDYNLWLRLIKRYKFANIKDRLIFLRKHESNISKLNSNKFIDSKYESLCHYFEFTKKQKYLDEYKYYFHQSTNLSRHSLIKLFIYKLLREFYKNLLVRNLKSNKI